MKFRAGGLEFNASVAEASQSPSPRTGEMLRSLTIQFRAQKAAMHEQALARKHDDIVRILKDYGVPLLETKVAK